MPSAMGELSVKKKEEMSLKKTLAFAVVFTDSACDLKLMYSQTQLIHQHTTIRII